MPNPRPRPLQGSATRPRAPVAALGNGLTNGVGAVDLKRLQPDHHLAYSLILDPSAVINGITNTNSSTHVATLTITGSTNATRIHRFGIGDEADQLAASFLGTSTNNVAITRTGSGTTTPGEPLQRRGLRPTAARRRSAALLL